MCGYTGAHPRTTSLVTPLPSLCAPRLILLALDTFSTACCPFWVNGARHTKTAHTYAALLSWRLPSRATRRYRSPAWHRLDNRIHLAKTVNLSVFRRHPVGPQH